MTNNDEQCERSSREQTDERARDVRAQYSETCANYSPLTIPTYLTEPKNSDSPSTPPSGTSTREQAHDMDGPKINLDIDAILHEHWLLTDDVDRIVGCVCGYRAPITEDGYDYGDRVVRHLLEVAAAWAEPVVSSVPVSPVDRLDLAAIEADLADAPAEVFKPRAEIRRTIGDGPLSRLLAAVPALVAEVMRLRERNRWLEQRFIDQAHSVQHEARDRLLDQLADGRATLDRVHSLVEHARKISLSPSMHVYVADLERALGIAAPRPHKLGSES